MGINFSKCYHQMYKKKLWTIFRGLWGNDKSTIYRKIMSKTEQICRGRKSSDLNTIYFLSKSISSIFISSFFIGWFVSNRTGGRYPFVSKPFLRIWPVYFIEKKKNFHPVMEITITSSESNNLTMLRSRCVHALCSSVV